MTLTSRGAYQNKGLRLFLCVFMQGEVLCNWSRSFNSVIDVAIMVNSVNKER